MSTRYHLGYQACAQEVSKYLDSNSDEEIELKTKLLNHLANCITGDAVPSHASSTAGTDRTGVPGRTSFNLVASVSSSLPDKQDACLLSSTSSSSSSSLSTSLLSSSSSVISSSRLAAATSSTASLLTSPLPQFLCSSSASASGVAGSSSAASVIIPIPISPLSIGTVSPASVASGILTPEKQSHQHQSGSQQLAGVGYTNSNSAAHSLDLSAVRITDDGVFQTLTHIPNNLNAQMDTGELKARRSLSLLSTSNGPALLTSSQSASEVNNNVIRPLLGNDSNRAQENAAGTLALSSTETIANANNTQEHIRLGLEVNSCNMNVDKSNDNVMNNINSTNTRNNLNNALAFPAFVNLSSGTALDERSHPIMQLAQPQLVQLLPQQQHQQDVTSGPPQRGQQQTQMLMSNNEALFNANTGIITNINQLQLVPTKTPSGEIAFVLSTTLLNPAPLALSSKPQPNFAIPLQCPPASSLSQQSVIQQIAARLPEKMSASLQYNQHNQEPQQLPNPEIRQSQKGNAELNKSINDQSRRECNSSSQTSSVFLTPGNENDQTAPLNLSSPNHKTSSSRSLMSDSDTDPSPQVEQMSAPSQTHSGRDKLPQLSSSSVMPTNLETNLIKPDSQVYASDSFSFHATPNYFKEKGVNFADVSPSQPAPCPGDSPLSVSGPRRAIGFEVPNLNQTYQIPSVAFSKPLRLEERANRAALPGYEMEGVCPDSSYRRGGNRSPCHSLSPPAAHSSGQLRSGSSDAGQPLRQDKSRALFRPW